MNKICQSLEIRYNGNIACTRKRHGADEASNRYVVYTAIYGLVFVRSHFLMFLFLDSKSSRFFSLIQKLARIRLKLWTQTDSDASPRSYCLLRRGLGIWDLVWHKQKTQNWKHGLSKSPMKFRTTSIPRWYPHYYSETRATVRSTRRIWTAVFKKRKRTILIVIVATALIYKDFP